MKTAPPTNTILHGNNVEILSQIPDASIDLIFADPPYFMQLGGELHRPDNSRVDAVDDDWDKFADLDAYKRYTWSWLSECQRILKPTGSIWVIGSYHNIFTVGAIMQAMDFWIMNSVVWEKSNPMPNFRGTRFTNSHEILIWAGASKDARPKFNYQAMKALNDDIQMRADWHLPICTGNERCRMDDGSKAHSTQKPEALLYRVILASSDPGDIVLDPFFGTGTTGAVAKRLGRNWLGIEREARYIEVASSRIASVQRADDMTALDVADRHKKEAKVPFGRVLEAGFLKPGDRLHFDRQTEKTAVVRADGHLLIPATGFIGSIHKAGAQFLGGNCNGWDHWYAGEVSINAYREQIRLTDAGSANTNNGANHA